MRNASVHFSIVVTFSLTVLGLVSIWPLSVMWRRPPEQKSCNSTLPFRRRLRLIYWWDQIFWQSWWGTCDDMSSPPKRNVSSPPVKFKISGGLSDFWATSGSIPVWVWSGMSESARTFSKSTKSANDGECCVGTDAFFLPCEAEVDGLEKSAPPSPACHASWTTSTASSVLAFLFLFVASPPRFLRPPGIIKADDVFS